MFLFPLLFPHTDFLNFFFKERADKSLSNKKLTVTMKEHAIPIPESNQSRTRELFCAITYNNQMDQLHQRELFSQ